MPSAPRNADAGARSVRRRRCCGGVHHGVFAPAQGCTTTSPTLRVIGTGRDDLAYGAAVERFVQRGTAPSRT